MAGYDRKSRRNYSTLGKYPRFKAERRLKSPTVEKRPIRFQIRSIVDRDFLRPNDWKFILHRRGPSGRPWIGLDPLEERAWQGIRGTLPERIIYKYLVERMHFIPEVDFEFQSCVASNHKILTADLRWVDAGSLVAGDELLSFTEDGDPMRKWIKGKVIFNKIEDMDAIKVKLSNGQEIITTPNHPWLIHCAVDKRDGSKTTVYSWVETRNLKVGVYIPVFFENIRPAKLQYLKHEKLTKIRQVRVISIESVGKVPIARLEVDKHTYIVEGFGMHNSLQGGRLDTGGIVADFLFRFLMIVINPLGPTHGEYWRHRKDEEQISALEELGYSVYMIEEADVYDEQKLEWWMRRIFGWVHTGSSDRVPSAAYDDPNITELNAIQDLVDMLSSKVNQL